MIFDYRALPGVVLDPEEAQLNEGGANAWDNCGAAIYALILRWLGNGDPYEPQQIMDLIEGKFYHGGEVSAKLINFFWAHRAQYPHLPPITVDQGGDVVQRARNAASLHFPTCNWWWCNSNGDIQPRNTGILHWSSVVYDDGANLGIFNIMRGQLVALPYAQARAAYAGEFTTFHAALGDDMNQQEHDWLASIVTALGLGAVDPKAWPVATPNFNYPARLAAIEAELAAIKAGQGSSGKPAPFTADITPK